MPFMLRELPIELELEVWKHYYKNCVTEIEYQHKFRWEDASTRLAQLVSESGSYQEGYSELEEMMEDHNLIRFQTNDRCYGCRMVGYFPCPLCKQSYFDNRIPDHVKFYI